MGRFGEAIARFERTLTDFERALGTDHPHTPRAHHLADAYRSAARLDEAIALGERTAD